MEKEIKLRPQEIPPPNDATPDEIRVKKVLELVSEGKNVNHAMAEAGENVMMWRRPDVAEAIKNLLEAGSFKDEVRRELVKAASTKAYVKLMDEGIKEDRLDKIKLGAEIGRDIAAEPGIGLKNTKPQVEVNLEFQSLSGLMEKIDKGDVIINAEEIDSTTNE